MHARILPTLAQRLCVLSLLGLLALASSARAAFTNAYLSVTVDASALAGACPGSIVPVTFTFTCLTAFDAQSPDIYAEFVSSTSGAVNNGFVLNSQPSGSASNPAWFVVEKNTSAAVNGVGTSAPDPATDTQNWGTSTWPNNGGWSGPTLSSLGQTETVVFNVEVPQGMLPNTAYALEVGVNYGNYQNPTGASEGYQAYPFTTGAAATCPAVTPPSVSLTQTLDSALAPGQDSLYLLNYSFTNSGAANFVQDTLPPCVTIVEVSPNPWDGSPATISGNTVTWRVQGAASSVASGTLYVEVVDSGCASGAQVCATAGYASGATGPWTLPPSAQSCGNAGSGPLTLLKSQNNAGFNAIANGTVEPAGVTINYVLTYNLSGSQMDCFDGFTTDTVGSYSESETAGQFPGPSYFGNWIGASSATGLTATWAIANNASGENGIYLYYPNSGYSNSGYNVLLNACPAMGPSFVGGEVVTDVQLMQPASTTMDVGVVLRQDANPADPDFGDAYVIVLSTDPYTSIPAPGSTYSGSIGAEGTGHLFVVKVTGANTWTPQGWAPYSAYAIAEDSNNSPVPLDTWYTIKTMELPSANCAGSSGPCSTTLYAKYWPVGSPEPAGWAITMTDPDAFGGAGTWYPGVYGEGAQAGYDNFRVYGRSSLQNAALWDTVPAGISFVSATPSAQVLPAVGSSGQLLQWNFSNGLNGATGNILPSSSGSFTWTGTVACAGVSSISNTGAMGAAGLGAPTFSNTTLLDPLCPQTTTATLTATGTSTPTSTPSVTTAGTQSPTMTGTATPSASPSPSVTPTWTSIAGASGSPSASPSASATPSATPTTQTSVSSTPTPSATLTVSVSPSLTPIPATATPLASGSNTATPTITQTPAQPAFTLSVTTNLGSCGIQSGVGFGINVTVCNNGGATALTSTVTLTLDPNLSFTGPYFTPTSPTVVAAGQTVTITYPGFAGGGACETITLAVEDYYFSSVMDCTLTNTQAVLAFNGTAMLSSALHPPLNCCMSPTATVTPTATRTTPPTLTPVPSLTLTACSPKILTATFVPDPVGVGKPLDLCVYLACDADAIEVQAFTPSGTRVWQWSDTGVFGGGWNCLKLPQTGLARGMYFFKVTASNGGQKTAKTTKLLVL